jgi:hypothetical protein
VEGHSPVYGRQQAAAEVDRREAEDAKRRVAVEQITSKEDNWHEVMFFGTVELLLMGAGIVLAISGSLILGLILFGAGAASSIVRWKRALDKENAKHDPSDYQ